MVTKKERNELMMFVGSVLMVAMVGIILTNFAGKDTLAGMASARLQCDNPTLEGLVELLNSCSSVPIGSALSCDAACGADVCVALNDNCAAVPADGSCVCCPNPCV